MKKTILVSIIAIFAFTNIIAQEKESSSKGLKGAWWGLGQIEYFNDEGADTSSFTILPVVGNFISPTVTVGLGVGYTTTTIGDEDAVDAIIVMPLVRKYWGVSDKFFLFAQGDVPMTFYDAATGYGINVRPGIDYFIGGSFTIEATFGQFGYNVIDYDDADSSGTTSLGFNMMNVNFGLKYLF